MPTVQSNRPKASGGNNFKNGLGAKQVNPAIAIVIAVVVVLIGIFVFVIKPGRDADQAQKNWTSPEAVAARSPEGKPKDAAHEALVQQLQAKEGRQGGRPNRRRDE